MSDSPISRKALAVAAAVAIAIPAEGLRQYAYRDPPGIWTVCYGSTTNVVQGKKYSLDECRQRLDTDMMQSVQIVERCAPGLPMNALVAFSDAVYNIGPTIVCDVHRSTAARLLRAGDWQAACKQLPRWNKTTIAGEKVELPGLTKRRNHEMAVCLADL